VPSRLTIRNAVFTAQAAAPSGPYSQAVRAGDLIFVSGQLPLDPGGALVGAGDIGAQTQAVLDNMKAILREAGSSLHEVVKTTIFLTDLDLFTAMNDVYAANFAPPHPARTTVETGRLPRGILIEIDCIAQAQRKTS